LDINLSSLAYLVELWPYAQRSRGIGVQQIFGKLAGFFSTNVNSIALDAIKWKYLAIYCGWITFEFLVVYFLYPETSGRTLEELAFRTFPPPYLDDNFELPANSVRKQFSRTTNSTRGPSLPSRSRFTTATAPMLPRPTLLSSPFTARSLFKHHNLIKVDVAGKELVFCHRNGRDDSMSHERLYLDLYGIKTSL
jgi:hypothetical protein